MARRRGQPPSSARRLREQQAPERGRGPPHSPTASIPRSPLSLLQISSSIPLRGLQAGWPSSHSLPPCTSPSPLCPEANPCHWRNPGSGVSLRTMRPMGPDGQGRGGPGPDQPQAVEQAPGPAASVLLASARLSLHKQGCIATTARKEPIAPAGGTEGARRHFPLASLPLGPRQARGTPKWPTGPVRLPVRASWAPLRGAHSKGVRGELGAGMPLALNPWLCCRGL